jgi:hypothetical protein
MRFQRLVGLVILLLALAAGLWFALRILQRSPAGIDATPLPPKVEDSILQLEPASLDRLTIHAPRDNQSIRVERGADGVWRLTEPLEDWAEPAAIRGVMEALYSRDWSEAPAEWADQSDQALGLDPAAISVEARAADGSTQLLRVGAAELMSRWRAATLDGKRLRIGEDLLSRLERSTELWRDHRILPLPPPAIHSLRWQPASGPAWAMTRQGETWRMLEPFAAPLDENVRPWIERMLGARALQVELSPLAARPAQQDALGILTVEGARESFTVTLHPDGAAVSHRDYLLFWDPEDFGVLLRPVESLRSRRVLDLDPDVIVTIRLEIGDEAAEFRRSAGGWSLDGHDDLPVEERGYVDALLREGMRLEGVEWLPRPATPPAGRVLYSISRTPRPQPGRVLCWWLDEAGRVLVGAEDADRCAASDVNFDLAGRELLRRINLLRAR